MAKYYRVNLYAVETDWTMEQSETLVGQAVVKKGLLYAKDFEGEKYKIVTDLAEYVEELETIYDNSYYGLSMYHGQNVYCDYPYQDLADDHSMVTKYVKREDFTPENKLSVVEVLEYALEYAEENGHRPAQNTPVKTKMKSIFNK